MCDTENDDDVGHVVLYAEEEHERSQLLGETFGHGILDCGCTKTVAGDPWLDSYVQ